MKKQFETNKWLNADICSFVLLLFKILLFKSLRQRRDHGLLHDATAPPNEILNHYHLLLSAFQSADPNHRRFLIGRMQRGSVGLRRLKSMWNSKEANELPHSPPNSPLSFFQTFLSYSSFHFFLPSLFISIYFFSPLFFLHSSSLFLNYFAFRLFSQVICMRKKSWQVDCGRSGEESKWESVIEEGKRRGRASQLRGECERLHTDERGSRHCGGEETADGHTHKHVSLVSVEEGWRQNGKRERGGETEKER